MKKVGGKVVIVTLSGRVQKTRRLQDVGLVASNEPGSLQTWFLAQGASGKHIITWRNKGVLFGTHTELSCDPHCGSSNSVSNGVLTPEDCINRRTSV